MLIFRELKVNIFIGKKTTKTILYGFEESRNLPSQHIIWMDH